MDQNYFSSINYVINSNPIASLNTQNQTIFDSTLLTIPIQQESSEINIGNNIIQNKNTETLMLNSQNINYGRSLPPLQITLNKNNDKNSLNCFICGLLFQTNDEINIHLLTHNISENNQSIQNNLNKKRNDCKLCGFPLRVVNVYENNMNILINNTDRNLDTLINMEMCDNCGIEYSLSNSTNLNNKKIDCYERYFCQLCDKSYKHNRDLRKHEKMIHGLKPSQLSKVKRIKNNLNKDIQNKNLEIIENKQFDNKNDDLLKNISQIKDKEQNKKNNSKYFCNKCLKSFRGPFELRRHIMTIHENNRPYKCNHCGKLFRDTYEVKRHNLSHLKNNFKFEFIEDEEMTTGVTNFPVNCLSQATFVGIDDHSFKKNYSIDNNLDISKNLQNDYYCGICDKNFRGANEFKRHYSVVHEKKYRYKCLHCGKLWRDQYDLKRHCKRSHFLDKDIDKGFIKQCLLDNHSVVSKTSINHIINNSVDQSKDHSTIKDSYISQNFNIKSKLSSDFRECDNSNLILQSKCLSNSKSHSNIYNKSK